MKIKYWAIGIALMICSIVMVSSDVARNEKLTFSPAMKHQINRYGGAHTLARIYDRLLVAGETKAATAMVAAISAEFMPDLSRRMAKRQVELNNENALAPVKIKSVTRVKDVSITK